MIKFWDKNTTYKKNDRVVYLNRIYESLKNNNHSVPAQFNDYSISGKDSIDLSRLNSVLNLNYTNNSWRQIED